MILRVASDVLCNPYLSNLDIHKQGLLEHKVHNAVGANSRHTPLRLGPPYERCGTSCWSNPCIPAQASRQMLILPSDVLFYAGVEEPRADVVTDMLTC